VTRVAATATTMADAAMGWVVAALAGAIVSLLYFAGLWWTVQRVAGARYPVALVAASFLTRVLLAAGALWLIMQGDVWRLLVALVAFLIVRSAVLWRVRPLPHQGRPDVRGT
jgi:F1F0 ATPase subunit 2